MKNYLDELNERQKQAVLNTEGPLLILAGAGAGKTKTITSRILHLIKSGINPESILAITFTNKAAKEMKERVMKMIENDVNINLPVSSSSRPFLSTFHSLGVHILKENAELAGLTRHFTIFDRGDSKTAVKEAIVMAGHDPKKIEPMKALGIISRNKGDFISQEEFEARSDGEYMGEIIAQVWRYYEGILRKEKALDFDDLLFKATKILHKHPEVRQKYQTRWKYIHVDEYQDTNKVQYEMLQALIGPDKNIAVVGDADQSIYGWRGADIKNILKFEEDFPEAKVILLEENYRSTQTILAAANTIISKNIYRKEKNLFTKNVQGDKMTLYCGYDETDEASFVANMVRELIVDGAPAEEIAVLYRANFQSRVLEEAFLIREIPYQMLGTKFFERREVRDILSYIRLALNPDSLSDLKRVINIPARGIGKVGLLKIMEGKIGDLPSGARSKYEEFIKFLVKIKEKSQTEKTSEVVKFTLISSGMEQMLKEGKSADDDRLENARELVTLATKYDAMVGTEGLEKLLEESALQSDQDNMEENSKAVKLMTVHASKGLEFDYVFISGLEEGLFPHERVGESNLSPEESEEERRLFYVALTRARKKVYLSYANVRTIFGNKQINVASQFINDIQDDHIEKEEPVSGIKSIFIDF